ncbi:VirB3 family type IV secretion system protein [Wielerella bovis]|uniref:type IV secretion system protein VirB3 n=1 Tax=Wielerella bovis TaxID=2917790 RepID=UPI002018E819|nr:VirB3 family type IV secretion system protein [Wielerella bovis]ULJ69327.1 VirB3 family type IV secretion system protein [Wielerella bovis]
MNHINNIDVEYPTFNGLNRQAMILGVPLIPFVVCLFVLMMLFMVSMTFLGGKSLFILLLVIPIFLALRSISANDDQAFKIYGIEIKWWLRRQHAELFNGATTIVSTKYGRQTSDYQRFFQQNFQETARPIGISTENLPTRYQ